MTVTCLTLFLPGFSRVLANLRNRKPLSGRDSGEPYATSHHGAYTRRGTTPFAVLFCMCVVFREVRRLFSTRWHVVIRGWSRYECEFCAVSGCCGVVAVVSVPSTSRLHRVLFVLRCRKPLSGRRMGGPSPFSIVGRTQKGEPVPSSYWLFCMCVVS